MWSASETATVTAPASAIWARWTAVDHWVDADDSLVSSRIEGPFEVGSTIVLKPKGSPTVKVKLIEVTPDATFSTVGKMPGATLHFDHTITSASGSTTFTQKVSITGPMAGLFGRLMGPRMARGLHGRVARLAELVAAG